MGRYIENIVDISLILIYRNLISTLDIGFLIYRYRISYKWNICNFWKFYLLFFWLFNINLKTDKHMSKIEYIIWQYDTSLHLVTSLLVWNRS